MPSTVFQITNNPYASVDWGTTLRLKASTHDHTEAIGHLQGYNDAGYDALAYFYYSGNDANPIYWAEYRWPLTPTWFSDAQIDALTNVQIWYPNVEQVVTHGEQTGHFCTPFISDYIENVAASPGDNEYVDLSDGIALSRTLGALPVFAHPYEDGQGDTDWGQHANEIWNGYYENERIETSGSLDRNPIMLSKWDTVLQTNPKIYGVCVNDWFGPRNPPVAAWEEGDPTDNGYIMMLCSTADYATFKSAFEAGAFLAVNDQGATKGLYPTIDEISVTGTVVFIDTTDSVSWIANGVEVGTGTTFDLRGLPSGSKYLRAEVTDGTSTVYVQPMAIAERQVEMIDLVSDSLQLHLKLDETETGNAVDSSPNAFTCTLGGGLDQDDDAALAKFDWGLTFHEVTAEHILCPLDAALDFNGGHPTTPDDFTLSAVVKRAATGSYDVVLQRGTQGTTSGAKQYMLAITSGNALWFVAGGVSKTWAVNVPADGEFHTLSVRCTSGVMEGFYDGVKQAGTANAGDWSTSGYTSTHQIVGNNQVSGTSNWIFNGVLDDVRIYDRALSDEEMALLHSGPYVAPASGDDQQQLLVPAN